MSGEFGSYCSGYADRQTQYLASDCAGGRYEVTRLMGELFAAMVGPMEGICRLEACDTGEDYPIRELIEHLPAMRLALAKIENYVRPFADVAQHARDEAIIKMVKMKEPTT